MPQQMLTETAKICQQFPVELELLPLDHVQPDNQVARGLVLSSTDTKFKATISSPYDLALLWLKGDLLLRRLDRCRTVGDFLFRTRQSTGNGFKNTFGINERTGDIRKAAFTILKLCCV